LYRYVRRRSLDAERPSFVHFTLCASTLSAFTLDHALPLSAGASVFAGSEALAGSAAFVVVCVSDFAGLVLAGFGFSVLGGSCGLVTAAAIGALGAGAGGSGSGGRVASPWFRMSVALALLPAF
jgi:hypothetical protein